MEKNQKMKKALLFILVSLLFIGCTTPVYIKPALPAYNPTMPERPELLEIDGTIEIPQEININQLLLMAYAEKLEIIIEGWESFYNELKTIYSNDNAAEKQI